VTDLAFVGVVVGRQLTQERSRNDLAFATVVVGRHPTQERSRGGTPDGERGRRRSSVDQS
jgi:hypothetical protein